MGVCMGVHAWVCMRGCACVGGHAWVCMRGGACAYLHEDNNRHEPDAVVGARATQELVGEGEDRLLGHPGLTGARARPHEDRLLRV